MNNEALTRAPIALADCRLHMQVAAGAVAERAGSSTVASVAAPGPTLI